MCDRDEAEKARSGREVRTLKAPFRAPRAVDGPRIERDRDRLPDLGDGYETGDSQRFEFRVAPERRGENAQSVRLIQLSQLRIIGAGGPERRSLLRVQVARLTPTALGQARVKPVSSRQRHPPLEPHSWGQRASPPSDTDLVTVPGLRL